MTINNSQQPPTGPIAQQLKNSQSNGQQAVTPQPNTQPPQTRKGKWGILDKTVWDWLQLLIIPVILAAGGFWFSEQQHNSDQIIALDQQHAAILQTYMDNIQELLLHDNLGKSKPTDDVAILARARTLTAIQGLDSDRNGLLIQFLYEAHLIGFIDSKSKPQPAIISLVNASLDNANLESDYLRGIDLRGTSLNSANLNNADLAYASIGCIRFGVMVDNTQIGQCTDFGNANLSVANLGEVNTDGTLFTNANFDQTNLTNTKFIGGNGSISQKQLDQTFSCTGAILPSHLVCHNNPD